MSAAGRILVLSATHEVRRVVGEALRASEYTVVEAATPTEALSVVDCEMALIDVARRSDDIDSVARHLLASETVKGALFFDGSGLEIAVRSLRTLLMDVRAALERFRGSS